LVGVLRSTVTVGDRKRIMLLGEAAEIAPKLVKALLQEGALKGS
jgi:hypothetical protein